MLSAPFLRSPALSAFPIPRSLLPMSSTLRTPVDGLLMVLLGGARLVIDR